MQKDLISRENVTKALGLDKVGLSFLSPFFYKLFGLEKANNFYLKHSGLTPHEFIDALFDDLNVNLHWEAEQLSRIPKTGPFWLISNHPIGIWDGLILMKLMKEVRPEFKVVTMFFLERLRELRPHIVPVNNWHDKKKALGGNHSGVKEILGTLKSGHPIGIFPGGSVARFQWKFRRVTDPPWNPTSLKLMERFKFPIVPIHIEGRNSNYFYALSFLSPTLRRGRNMGEFFNKKGRTFPIRIGEPILPDMRPEANSTEEFGNKLREMVYGLSEK